jgi:hypothetical protein
LACSRDKHLDEPKATPFMIKEFARVLKYELDTFEYKIENVCSWKKCKFTLLLDKHREIRFDYNLFIIYIFFTFACMFDKHGKYLLL